MKQIMIGLSLVALAATGVAGIAYAQHDKGPRADADSDGVVTRAEAQAHAADAFTRMDANKDGKLDQADRNAMRTKHLAMMFDNMDADKNGQISREEFNTAHAPGKGPGMGMSKGPGMGDRHGGGMMARMADADKDGAVSQAEFAAAALARFDSADANKDGKVTGEERAAARTKMHEQWRAKHAPAS